MDDRVEVWEFDETIKDYHHRLDGLEVQYTVGEKLRISFIDAERPSGDGGSCRPTHKYTFVFSEDLKAAQIINVMSREPIDSIINGWIYEKKLVTPFCAVFRLTDSAYLRWFYDSDIGGTRDMLSADDLVHYLFVTADQIYEVIDDVPPTIEVEDI